MKSKLLCIIFTFLFANMMFISATAMSRSQILLKDDCAESSKELKDIDLLDFVPQELHAFRARSKDAQKGTFLVCLLPLAETAFTKIDSTLSQYTLALYQYSSFSALSVLQHDGVNVKSTWESGNLTGIGRVSLEDLSGDGIPEILVNLMLTGGPYQNVFIFGWDAGELINLLPSHTDEHISDLCGYVEITPSDTGATSRSYHPTEGIERKFFLGKGDDCFKLISERRINEE